MEWREMQPLPEICKECGEEDCYNCDAAGQRWYLSREEELIVRRKMLVKAIERLQKQVVAIDEALNGEL